LIISQNLSDFNIKNKKRHVVAYRLLFGAGKRTVNHVSLRSTASLLSQTLPAALSFALKQNIVCGGKLLRSFTRTKKKHQGVCLGASFWCG